MNFLNKIKDVEKNHIYEGDNLVVGIKYGSEGIMPCHSKCQTSCIGSSGDNLCGNYRGHHKIKVEDKILFIVKCDDEITCINHD